MTNFHRYYIPNGVIFITCVTQSRFPYLREEEDVQLFFDTSRNVQKLHPFRLLAYVILPDHFHWLIRPENADGNFSNILHSLKRNFTLNYKKNMELTGHLSSGKLVFGIMSSGARMIWKSTLITFTGIQ